MSEIFISYSIEGQKPSNKRIASSAVPLWGSSARIGEGACQEARKHTVLRQRDAGHSAGKGCLSGMAEGEKRNSYNDRSCRGGNTSTALLCRYGMTLDLLFESVNGNIII